MRISPSPTTDSHSFTSIWICRWQTGWHDQARFKNEVSIKLNDSNVMVHGKGVETSMAIDPVQVSQLPVVYSIGSVNAKVMNASSNNYILRKIVLVFFNSSH